MVWYSQQWVGHTMFMPIGAFGALLPYLSPEQEAQRSAVGRWEGGEEGKGNRRQVGNATGKGRCLTSALNKGRRGLL